MLPRALVVACLLAAGAGCLGPLQSPPGPGAAGGAEIPDVVWEGARFHTGAGDFTMVFFPEDAPRTVALYQAYLREGYFAGRTFGRVVPGHVIQVQDAGGAGATEDARRVPLEASPQLNFTMGAVGIARSDDPDSGGPEFFIMDFATSHLWGNYTVFGQLVDGIEVVHAIARAPAVETPRIAPEVNALLPDRTALDPVRITAAEAVQLSLPAAQAARLPGRVGQNVRDGDARYSLEWPADLAPGNASELVWFVRMYNGTAAPAPSRLTMRVEGPSGTERPALRPDPAYPEILAWDWTPREAGPHTAVLELDGRDAAAIGVFAGGG